MNAMVVAHVVASVLVLAASLVAFSRASQRAGRVAAGVAGLAGIVTLATGLVRVRTWEPAYRRAVYLASRSTGLWLDRKMHVGLAACAFAIVAGLLAAAPEASARSRRLACALAAACALLAFAIVAIVHARVPSSSLDGP